METGHRKEVQNTLSQKVYTISPSDMGNNDASNGPPPTVQMISMVSGFQFSQALYVAAKLRIPDLLESGPKHVEDLANKVECDAERLKRVLRALTTQGVFVGDPCKPGVFSNSPLSLTLCTKGHGSVRGFAIAKHEAEYMPFAHLLDIVKGSKKSGPELAYGMKFFDYLKKHPEINAAFCQAMADMTESLRGNAFEYFDQTICDKKNDLIVDVGGGNGSVLIRALEKCPYAKGIVLDLEFVRSAAEKMITSKGMINRVRFEAGDFFNKQTMPAKASVYMLCFTLHDWSDEECIVILQSVKHAMNPHSKVAILEMVIPVGNERHPSKDMDLTMLGVVSGKERTQDQWGKLLQAGGLKMEKIVHTSDPVSWIYASL